LFVPQPSDPSDAHPEPREPAPLAAADIVPLLNLMGALAAEKRNPRSRRLEFLGHLLARLPATAAAAFLLKDITPHAPPIVAGLIESGFKPDSHAQLAFLQEFNHAPFQDAFSRAALLRFLGDPRPILTFRRSDLVTDAAWHDDSHVQAYRRPSGLDDVLLSLARPADKSAETFAFAILVFRPAGFPQRFTPRDRALLDVAHAGLAWMYKEEAAQKNDLPDDLPPRLQQTLKHLLTGDSERQIARKMQLSPHTVHDYVKALYTRFAVSSRQELTAWWVRRGHPLPPRHE
jgi:DNA-binding CsgD family transcriptional regulator